MKANQEPNFGGKEQVFAVREVAMRNAISLWSLLIAKSFSFFVCFVLFFRTSAADEFHYINSLVGDRPSGMGGAYTAISTDPAGLYYNPAGIAFAHGQKFSINVNAYNISTKTYQGALNKATGESENWTLRSSQLVPNFFGIIYKLGNSNLGFSYAVVDSFLRDQDQIFYDIRSAIPGTTITRYVINIDDEDKVYNMGPSYAVKLREDFSFGITLYFHYRSGKIIRNHFINLSNGEFNWENYYLSWTEYGIKPIVGFLWKPIDSISTGLSFSRTFILDSERKHQSTWRGPASLGFGPNDVDFTMIESYQKRKLPYKTSFGIAYSPSTSLLLSVDMSHYTAVEDRKSVFNGALGVEYYVTPSIALRVGGFTDFANTPKLKTGLADQPEHIDIYGGTFSITYYRKDSFFTFGAIYSYGSGKAQVLPGATTQQDAKINSVGLFIGTGSSF